MIGISVHLQPSLFPHLGQLQEHNNNEVLHPIHLVYSAKSSFKSQCTFNIMEDKFVKKFLKICLVFYINSNKFLCFIHERTLPK